MELHQPAHRPIPFPCGTVKLGHFVDNARAGITESGSQKSRPAAEIQNAIFM